MKHDPISHLRRWIHEHELDAFLVAQPQNRSYLSHWFNEDTEGAGMLMISENQQIVLTNTLYKEIAEKEAIGWTVIVPSARGYALAIAELASEYAWKKIGFESSATTYAEYEKIKDVGKDLFTLKAFEHSPIEDARLVKQPDELELLKHAISITDQTFEHICEWIQPGMTEKEARRIAAAAAGRSPFIILDTRGESYLPAGEASVSRRDPAATPRSSLVFPDGQATSTRSARSRSPNPKKSFLEPEDRNEYPAETT